MAFTTDLQFSGSVATITLTGELDRSNYLEFQTLVEQAANQKPQRLVLLLKDLEYMASAGLRVLVFAKQKLGSEADIYVVGAQEPVLDTLQKTGFDQSVIIVDEYKD